jgi:thiol:disulfide interchange protein
MSIKEFEGVKRSMLIRNYVIQAIGMLLFLLSGGFLPATNVGYAQDFGGFGDFSFGGADGGEPVEFAADFEITEGGREGKLRVKATLSPPWYIYSVTQPPGGPLKTEIELKGDQAKLTGPFQASKPPKIVKSEVFKGIPIEEHFGEVTWTAPIEIAEGVKAEDLKLTVSINGQTCIENGSCKPISDKEVEAKFTGFIKAPEVPKDGPFRDSDSHVAWTVELKPSSLPPGGKGELIITGTPDEGYHLYPFVMTDDETDFRTLLIVDQMGGISFGEPKADKEPKLEVLVPGQDPIAYHEGVTRWIIPFEVPKNAADGKRLIDGWVGYQACNDKSCDQPLGFKFSGEINVSGSSGGGTNAKLALAKADFVQVADHPARLTWVASSKKDTATEAETSGIAETGDEVSTATMSFAQFITYIGSALLGGLILNFMPCVLPVIGLKLMGFAQKGKQDTHRIEVLDLWFILGILSVLWALAAMSIGANYFFQSQFNWGEQFTITEFKVTLTAIVFAMALSFLGVWEIPIPGFAATKKSGELMEQEGPIGAFFKGFFTTLLATPCSGPLLGVVFGACLGQPGWVVFSLFTAIGIGLASPYILIAIRPSLLFWLPKPGPWMNTLKEIMAFPLLFTVVFLISTINRDYRIATLALMMVIWLACWLIGKVPGYESIWVRGRAWLASSALIAASAFLFFTYLGPLDKRLDWVPYSESKLAQLRSEGKTVMIDFTADWCLTCKLNLATAIETEDVAALVKSNRVVPLLADWTDPSDEIKNKLSELRSASIPLLAIYPPDGPPIVLRDSLLKETVIDALKKAGPSRANGASKSSTSSAAAENTLKVTPASNK